MDIQINSFDSKFQLPKTLNRDKIVDFLFTHLEQYGDKKEDIAACLEYVFDPTRGGHIFAATEDQIILGICVVNHTGMSGYIPEHILVYIAVDKKCRGMGIGAQIMQKVVQTCTGSIALHVEPDNPAKKLYERLGFTNKYLEMRLQK